MRFLFLGLGLYASLLAWVLVRYGLFWVTGPNLLLLFGLVAALPGGYSVAWAAAAGLLLDALYGRPLGVTMLLATLTATCLSGAVGTSTERWVLKSLLLACGVTMVDFLARLLGSGSSTAVSAESMISVRIGISTGSCAAACGAAVVAGRATLRKFAGLGQGNTALWLLTPERSARR